jgi:hypothetical protein
MKHVGIVCVLLIGCWALPLSGACGQERALQMGELPPASLANDDLPPPSPLPSPPPLDPMPAAPGCPSGAPCAGRTISVPRLTLLEEQNAIPVPKLAIREVMVGVARGLDVEYKESPQIVTEWTLQPREVIQTVPCTTMVPVTVTDPCTGKCSTEYKSCPIVRPVKITVFDKVPVQRAVNVGVPCLKPGQPVLANKLVVDCTMEPAIASRFQLLAVPNQVHVPVCPVCPIPHP